MITFTCSGCGRPFTVRDQDAGRQARCKTCGAVLTVPEPATATVAGGPSTPSGPDPADTPPAVSSQPPRRIPMRIRRLTADAEQMAAAFRDFPPIRVVSTEGDPPEVYQIEYRVKGLDRPAKKKQTPVVREQHLVEVRLTSEYPRTTPQCRMLTPVFHPNIDPSHICVGDHWTAGERLVDLAVRIGEMLAYQAYNIQSPLDAEAAMWADLNVHQLPTDTRSMRPGDM
jgi:ubiquitin-protein ligase/ribosomal protein S27E